MTLSILVANLLKGVSDCITSVLMDTVGASRWGAWCG
jgi:hypothetical protein